MRALGEFVRDLSGLSIYDHLSQTLTDQLEDVQPETLALRGCNGAVLATGGTGAQWSCLSTLTYAAPPGNPECALWGVVFVSGLVRMPALTFVLTDVTA